MAKQHEIPVPQRKGLRWFALILVLICELMAHTWVRTESTQAMLRISQAQARVQKCLSYRKALNLERDRLASDGRITRIARTRLGLTSDVSDQTIYIQNTGLPAMNPLAGYGAAN
ncbi:MAG: cell division protein FtsL [Desulfobacter sp.]|nr:MAG: cell division protein FtsL [Desulfobacter sp.]